jgi:hypothetical protein
MKDILRKSFCYFVSKKENFRPFFLENLALNDVTLIFSF